MVVLANSGADPRADRPGRGVHRRAGPNGRRLESTLTCKSPAGAKVRYACSASSLINRGTIMRLSARLFAAAGIAVAAALPLPAAHAQLGNMLNQGGGKAAGGMGGLGGMGGMLPGQSLTAGSTSNAAGVLTFCIKNNYLGGGGATSVRDSLMGKLPGGAATTDSGYTSGANGILDTGNGKTLSLSGATSGAKAEITKKACDQVLSQAKGML